jgi:putative peptide zinc metalloprotease protein
MMSLPKWLLAARALVAVIASLLVVGALGAAHAVDAPAGGSGSATTAAGPDAVTPAPSSTEGSTSSDGAQPAGGAGAGGMDNEVVLVNTQDGRHLARSSVAVAPVLGDVVDNQNAAYAYSRCSDCRTVAVAVQVVLVMGNPSSVTPRNLALAVNQDCERCESMASAYQYVLTTDGIVHFSAAGEREIAALRGEIAGVTGSDLPFAELDARLDALVERLWQVIDNELVAAGARFGGAPSKKTSVDTSGDPSPTPSESPDESPAPSPSPAPSDAAEPSPSPGA